MLHTAEDDQSLALLGERMRNEFAELRRHFRTWQKWVAYSLTAIVFLLVAMNCAYVAKGGLSGLIPAFFIMSLL